MDDYKPDDTNYIALASQDDDKLEEIASFIENKVISADGLTLAEVFQVLVQMLNGDLELVKKVLLYANMMVKHGMKIPQESRLTKSDVRRALQNKKGTAKSDFVESPPVLPNAKSITKKGRGV
ncbi:hypothetical protein IC220_04755 [Wolbachia endosymbiont of Pentalonia nigronervosa]|jgi:hypothetical protein|uniref:hypothetical protein n=1 Tax=Wolbachia endosymbiont of Pentalonia nigronervosa TaxID=1301914 RepID=UPI00165F26A4|nr:hypothetical protein [Wolbachia endosymbiont of Pentalonia nigronervosa]MBD0391750.1 hypothetical protein [Wolbachia endosymbiont of Pentalonia nigronervosa]